MRRKLLLGALGVMTAALGWNAFGTTTSSQALDCPGALATPCGAADLVVSTVCNPQTPPVPTVGFVTIQIDSTSLLACADLPLI